MNLLLKLLPSGLERLLSGKEHVLFFQRTRTQSAYNCLQLQGSSTLFWTVQALCSHVYVPYPHIDMQLKTLKQQQDLLPSRRILVKKPMKTWRCDSFLLPTPPVRQLEGPKSTRRLMQHISECTEGISRED